MVTFFVPGEIRCLCFLFSVCETRYFQFFGKQHDISSEEKVQPERSHRENYAVTVFKKHRGATKYFFLESKFSAFVWRETGSKPFDIIETFSRSFNIYIH